MVMAGMAELVIVISYLESSKLQTKKLGIFKIIQGGISIIAKILLKNPNNGCIVFNSNFLVYFKADI